MKKSYLFIFFICLTIPFVSHVYSAQEQPAIMKPEVMKAARGLNLTEEQKPLFGKAVGDFTTGRIKAIRKLIRQPNATDLPRSIRRKTNGLLKKMDKTMKEFLTEEQLPAYENYREVLKANLKGG